MYTIKCDSSILHSPVLEEEGNMLLEAVITEELNKASTLSYTILPSNPEYNTGKKLKSMITVNQTRDSFTEELFRGRIMNDSSDFYNQKKVYCEGELAFFLDTLMRPYGYVGNIQGHLKNIIDNHNSQVDSEKKFELGNVTVENSNDFIVRSSENISNSWEVINNDLLDMLGGYIRIRKKGNKRYVDYLKDYDSTNNQVIAFGKNLLDLSKYIDAAEVFTVLIPTGATVTEGDSSNVVDITSVNNGSDYIVNEAGIHSFGMIWRTVNWSNITEPEKLLSIAQAYLDAAIELATTITIRAVDLSLINVDIQTIKVGDMIRVLSVPHNLDTYMLVSRVVRNLIDPGKSEITLGSTVKNSSDITALYYSKLEKLQKKLNIV